jgi:hypothetical protein
MAGCSLQQLVLPDTALTAAQPGPLFSSRFVARNRYEFVAEFLQRMDDL